MIVQQTGSALLLGGHGSWPSTTPSSPLSMVTGNLPKKFEMDED